MNRFTACVTVTLLTGSSLFLGAPGASAMMADCRSGNLCLWEHGEYGGQLFQLATEDSTFHNNICPGCVSSKHTGSNGTWGDMISSYYNLSPRSYCIYFHTNYGGESYRLTPFSFGNFDSRQNDEISSARPC